MLFLRSPFVLTHHALKAFFVAAFLLVTASTQLAHAQGQVKSSYGDWQLRCDKPSGGATEQCALMQTVSAEDRPNVGLTVIVVKSQDAKSDSKGRILRILAPLGVLLPSGLGLKIDSTDVGRAGFVRCLPSGCVAEVMMDDKLFADFSKGQNALFIIFQTPDEGIGIPIALKGFAEGFNRLP